MPKRKSQRREVPLTELLCAYMPELNDSPRTYDRICQDLAVHFPLRNPITFKASVRRTIDKMRANQAVLGIEPIRVDKSVNPLLIHTDAAFHDWASLLNVRSPVHVPPPPPPDEPLAVRCVKCGTQVSTGGILAMLLDSPPIIPMCDSCHEDTVCSTLFRGFLTTN